MEETNEHVVIDQEPITPYDGHPKIPEPNPYLYCQSHAVAMYVDALLVYSFSTINTKPLLRTKHTTNPNQH